MTEKIIVPSGVSLEVIEGNDTGKNFTIDIKTVTIGRQDICNFVLSDEHMSKKHCQVVYRKDHFTAIDLNSLNKTKVNDKIYVQKNLKSGDILTLGKTKIKFTWDKQPEKDFEMLEEADIPAEDLNTDDDAIKL